MKKPIAIFNFKFSYGVLIGLGEKTKSIMARDEAELLTYGITPNDRNTFGEAVEELKNMPTDDEFKGMVTELTTTKDQLADQVMVGIRTVMVRVGDAFGENSGTYNRFGTSGLSKLTDLDLLQCIKRVLRMTNTYLSQLEAKGQTPKMVENLQELCNQFDQAVAAKEDAALAREVATEQRITLANELYARIARISGFGKDYWFTRNQAKYSDYVIYDTPSGAKEGDAPAETAA